MFQDNNTRQNHQFYQKHDQGGFGIFKYETFQIRVQIKNLDEFGLIKEIQEEQNLQPHQDVVIELPQWTTQSIFKVLKLYLESDTLQSWTSDMSDVSLQRLLWLGDYLQCEKFQEQSIQHIILNNIKVKNSLVFLNESFKKLKACEQSSDMWYMLLNNTMNFASKNLFEIYESCQNDFQKVNYKILEEVIERSLKSLSLNPDQTQQETIIKILQHARKRANYIDLLKSQREHIKQKKINYQNHPSISWKLHNLANIVNKETNPFKFNDMYWKLVARTEKTENNQKILRVYLKLEDKQSSQQNNNINQEIQENFNKIISIYFKLKVNDKDLQKEIENQGFQVKHIVKNRQKMFTLCEVSGENQLNKYINGNKLEFTVYLSTDYAYTLLINYLSLNYKQFKNQQLGEIIQEDLIAVGKSWPLNMQQHALTFACQYAKNFEQCQNPVELFESIDYTQITLETILPILQNELIQKHPLLRKLFSDIRDQKTNKSLPSTTTSNNIQLQQQQQSLPNSNNNNNNIPPQKSPHQQSQQQQQQQSLPSSNLNSNIKHNQSLQSQQQQQQTTGKTNKSYSIQTDTKQQQQQQQQQNNHTTTENSAPINKLERIKRNNSVSKFNTQQDANSTQRSINSTFTPNKSTGFNNMQFNTSQNKQDSTQKSNNTNNQNNNNNSMSKYQIQQQLNSKSSFQFSKIPMHNNNNINNSSNKENQQQQQQQLPEYSINQRTNKFNSVSLSNNKNPLNQINNGRGSFRGSFNNNNNNSNINNMSNGKQETEKKSSEEYNNNNYNNIHNINEHNNNNNFGQSNAKFDWRKYDENNNNNYNDNFTISETLMKERENMKKQIMQKIDIKQFVNKQEYWLEQEFEGLNVYA